MTETKHLEKKHPERFFTGLMIGWLAGTAAMLLFAPQSGKQTRSLIGEKSIELRDQTDAKIKEMFARIRSGTKKVTDEVQDKAGELKQLGQDKIAKQLGRMSATLEAGKKAVEAA
jgi:gas vesicle protein